MRRPIIMLAIALFVLGLIGAAARAQTRADAEQCKSPEPDIAIPGCSRLVAGGRLTPADRSSAYSFRAFAYLRKGRIDDAMADADLSVSADPRSVVGYVTRGDLNKARGKDDLALADAERALQIKPDNVRALRLRAGLLLRRGQARRALADLDRAAKVAPKDLFVIAERAQAYYVLGESPKAVSELTRLVELNPSNADLYIMRGETLNQTGDGARAIADFSRAIALNPRYWRARLGRAAAYVTQKDYERAMSDIDEAQRLAPNQAEVAIGRASAFLSQGNVDRALREVNRAIELSPESGRLYSSRCIVYLARDEGEKALADCNRAIELNPYLSGAYVERGMHSFVSRQFERSIQDYDRALELIPANHVALSRRARSYMALSRDDAAARDLDSALRLQPKYAIGLMNRGMLAAKRGDDRAALSDLSAALALDGRLIEAVSTRAEVYLRRGEQEKAITDFREVLKLPARQSLEKQAQIAAAERLTALQPGTIAALNRPSSAPSAPAPRMNNTQANAPLAAVTPAQAPAVTGSSGRRVALLIGNSAYANAGRLNNPANDVRALASVFRQIGFSEVVERYDLSLSQLTATLREFGDQSAGADWAVIYFSGHGLEMGGTSFIVPIDARLERDTHVADESVPLERVLQKVEGARALRLVILDACRNNPFTSRMTRSAAVTRAIGRGLAPVEPEGDVLVAYATKHGTVALDGDGANSPYALALAQHLVAPNVDVRVMFGRVRDSVRRATNNQQEPYTYGSIGGDLRYFVASR